MASSLCWQGQSSYAQSTLPSSLDLPVHEAPDAVQFYSSEELHSVLSLTTYKAHISLALIYRIGKPITEQQLCFSPFCITWKWVGKFSVKFHFHITFIETETRKKLEFQIPHFSTFFLVLSYPYVIRGLFQTETVISILTLAWSYGKYCLYLLPESQRAF